MINERILLLTLSFGAGHVRAAQALGAEFIRRKPDADIRIVDALENCGFLFRVFYFWSYWLMIRLVPNFWGTFFDSRVERNDKHTAPVWAWRFGCRGVLAEIKTFQPAMIVCCEVGASELAVIARQAGLTSADIVNVITDFESEPIWVRPEVSLYVVSDESVRQQLEKWGAPAESIYICGIPIERSFGIKYSVDETRQKFGLDGRPILLIMGGGTGPTRMDEVCRQILSSSECLQIVALPGRDTRMQRKLARLKNTSSSSLHIVNWTNDVARLMQAADVLITKSGGLTLSEAAATGVPLVLFDSIPGPERSNSLHFVAAGAAVMTSDSSETACVSIEILNNREKRSVMASNSAQLAKPNAARDIVDLALSKARFDDACYGIHFPRIVNNFSNLNGPLVLILTISNGFGHVRLAQAIARALYAERPSSFVLIVDVGDFMSPLARFTHLTAYLWLVKYLPRIWGFIDSFQKKQSTTSPKWFYRRGCRALFDLVVEIQPSAIVATEVGCCEIAALIKGDLCLEVPLAAVNGEMDADRAWIQSGVDLYSCVTDECAEAFITNGAAPEIVKVLGPTLSTGFDQTRDRNSERVATCDQFNLDSTKPLILIAGGSEGIGSIEHTARKLLEMTTVSPQILVLTGRNERLRSRCEKLAKNKKERERLRVLSWTRPEELPSLMSTADLMVSKLGSMFYEAIASELPIVALEPPPGAERLQYRLLDDWGVGRGVRNVEEIVSTVEDLLNNPKELSAMRANARKRQSSGAAQHVARWLIQRGDSGLVENVYPSPSGA